MTAPLNALHLPLDTLPPPYALDTELGFQLMDSAVLYPFLIFQF